MAEQNHLISPYGDIQPKRPSFTEFEWKQGKQFTSVETYYLIMGERMACDEIYINNVRVLIRWHDREKLRKLQIESIAKNNHPATYATPCSGTISIQDIRNEFYGGGGPTDLATLGANILGRPVGQTVHLSDFYCLTNVVPVSGLLYSSGIDRDMWATTAHRIIDGYFYFKGYDGMSATKINWHTTHMVFDPTLYGTWNWSLAWVDGSNWSAVVQDKGIEDGFGTSGATHNVYYEDAASSAHWQNIDMSVSASK